MFLQPPVGAGKVRREAVTERVYHSHAPANATCLTKTCMGVPSRSKETAVHHEDSLAMLAVSEYTIKQPGMN